MEDGEVEEGRGIVVSISLQLWFFRTYPTGIGIVVFHFTDVPLRTLVLGKVCSDSTAKFSFRIRVLVQEFERGEDLIDKGALYRGKNFFDSIWVSIGNFYINKCSFSSLI